MESPHYAIFPLERPITDTVITKYSSLRLLALKTDPASFSSTYAREAAFTEDMWRGRLDAIHKTTFVASVLDRNVWVGTVTVIGPSEVIASSSEPFEKAGVGRDWDIYFLAGMWVHHEHRGKGLGSKLVRSLKEWVLNHDDPKNDSEKRDKVVALLVDGANEKGRALYEKTGFVEILGMEKDEGVWMMCRVRNRGNLA